MKFSFRKCKEKFQSGYVLCWSHYYLLLEHIVLYLVFTIFLYVLISYVFMLVSFVYFIRFSASQKMSILTYIKPLFIWIFTEYINIWTSVYHFNFYHCCSFCIQSKFVLIWWALVALIINVYIHLSIYFIVFTSCWFKDLFLV